MLLGIDILHRLRTQAHTLQSLASVLPASEDETQRVLVILERDGLVSAAPGGWAGDRSSFTAVYTVTSAG